MEFPGLESHEILVKVMESHGKAIYFRNIKRQKQQQQQQQQRIGNILQ